MYEKISQIRELVDYCLSEHNINVPIRVFFNTRLRTTIGYAKFNRLTKTGSIEFNPRLWTRASISQRENTIIHEVAHIITFIKHPGVSGHGYEWRQIHRSLGREPERTHKVDCSGIRKIYMIECKLCGKNYNITKTLITRRLNKSGCIGQCKCGMQLNTKDIKKETMV